MASLVLLRHGESAWNAADVFTGWIDVRLSDNGQQQARQAGQLVAVGGHLPDVVHTSLHDVALRLLPYWYDAIVPDLRRYRYVLVVSDGNTLRALIKQLKTVSDDAVSRLEVPNAKPLYYEFPAGQPGEPS